MSSSVVLHGRQVGVVLNEVRYIVTYKAAVPQYSITIIISYDATSYEADAVYVEPEWHLLGEEP